MNMRKIWCRLIALVASLIASVMVLAHESGVAATVELEGRELALVFTVTNASSASLKTIEARMPWGYPPSLLVVARPVDGDLLPPALRLIEVPSNTEITIPPGGVMRGRVLLQHRFGRALAAALRTGPVLLLWACRSPFDPGEYVSGHIVIPQQK